MPYDVLDGVKVVELSMYAFAPSSAAVLADWGADVVKVVAPHIRDTDGNSTNWAACLWFLVRRVTIVRPGVARAAMTDELLVPSCVCNRSF